MAILVDEGTRLIVQGITGREGSARTRFMLEYGPKVIAGTSPGKGGQEVWGVPVFDTVEEALEEIGHADATVTFIPGPQVKNAVIESIEAGIDKIFMPVERVPLHDIFEMVSKARKEGTMIVGPGSAGVVSPGKGVAGWLGGTDEAARTAFRPGPVTVLSRSGGQTTTVSWHIAESGLGVQTAVHIGTEPVLGTNLAEYLPLCEEDDETEAVAVYGEIGGVAEQEVAGMIEEGEFTKPAVTFIAGRGLPTGVRFSHASAMIQSGGDTYESKREALEEAGVVVVNQPKEIGPALVDMMGK